MPRTIVAPHHSSSQVNSLPNQFTTPAVLMSGILLVTERLIQVTQAKQLNSSPNLLTSPP